MVRKAKEKYKINIKFNSVTMDIDNESKKTIKKNNNKKFKKTGNNTEYM